MSPVKRTPWVWVSLPKWECGCWGSFLPIPGRWLVPLTQQVIICIFFLQLALASQHMILRKRPQSTESEGKGAYYREWPGRGTVQMNYLRCGFPSKPQEKKNSQNEPVVREDLWSSLTTTPTEATFISFIYWMSPSGTTQRSTFSALIPGEDTSLFTCGEVSNQPG